MQSDARRFACTSCGRCCTRGPEMELSEATALADTFVTSMLFKVHSLPLGERSQWAGEWWRTRKSRIPLRPALDEAQRHLRQFADRRVDRPRDRQVFLEVSAIVEDDGTGHCPALVGDLCSIYRARPLTCRTVPLHYSRAPSTLQNYLDQFTATPGYRCDTGSAAPIVLDGNKVIDANIQGDRERAVELAKTDRRWKGQLINLMSDGDQAAPAGLPSYDAVLANSDNGYATMVPMIVAWRVANAAGLLSGEEMRAICGRQALLLKRRLASRADALASRESMDLLAMYELEFSRLGLGNAIPSPAA